MKITFILFPVTLLLLASCGGDAADNTVSVNIVQLSQDVNYTMYARGQEVLYELKEISQDRSVPDVQKKVHQLFVYAQEIDKYTEEQIAFLENLKMDLLRSVDGKMNSRPTGKPDDILLVPVDKRDPLRPTSYALYNVKYSGTTGFLEYGSAKGQEIIRQMETFRKRTTEKIAESSSTGEQRYFFKAPMIRNYADYKELDLELNRSISMSNVSPDDQEMIKLIYKGLTFRTSDWKSLLSKDCPWEMAFQLLSELQFKVLRARADALTVIRQRVGGDNYRFNKILVVTPGPEYAKAGTDVDFDVLITAFDSDNQPLVKITQGAGHLVETREGKAKITARVPKSGSMQLSGTITILNKSGIPKTLPWTKTITAVE